MITNEQTENQNASEDSEALELAIAHLANVETIIEMLHNADTAKALETRMDAAWNLCYERWNKLCESQMGDDLISDQELDLLAHRRENMKDMREVKLR